MTMFSTSEQRELSRIADGLRADDRRFTRRMAVWEGVLRWTVPGRQDFLFLLAMTAMLAIALLACVEALVELLGRCQPVGWSGKVSPEAGQARGAPRGRRD